MNPARDVAGEIRYSRDIGLLRAATMGIGVGLATGVFILLSPVVWTLGRQAPPAYLLIALLNVPLVLSLGELASIKKSRGLLQLARFSQNGFFSFAAGWILLGGSTVLGGMLARGIAEYVAQIARVFFDVQLNPLWLGPAVVVLLTVNNILGTRENRWGQNAVVGLALLTLLIAGGKVWLGASFGKLGSSSPIWSYPAQECCLVEGEILPVLALLSGCLWGLVLILVVGRETRQSSKNAPRALFATLGILGLSWVGAAVASSSFAGAGSSGPKFAVWQLLFAFDKPGWSIWMLAVASMLLLGSLNRVLLTLGSVATEMAQAGFLPKDWQAPHHRLNTLSWALVAGGVAIAAVSVLTDLVWLAFLVSFAFLLVMALVNLPTLFSRASNLPASRAIVLPFPPLIPGLSVAISLFLLVMVPGKVIVVGIIWLALGGIWYVVRGRQGAVEARHGVTIFGQEPQDHGQVPFRILVPLANPYRSGALLDAAQTLAGARGGDVIALHVVRIPEQVPLSAGQHIARQQSLLLQRLFEPAVTGAVPVYPVVRLAHLAVNGILDTAQEEGCDLILMGWRGDSGDEVHDMGPIIDQVVARSSCDVSILKGDIPGKLTRILVPTAGGPHSPAAIRLAVDLAEVHQSEVQVITLVRGPSTGEATERAQSVLQQALSGIESVVDIRQKVAFVDDIKQGILREAGLSDLLLLGASEEGFLDQITFGGLPEELARACQKPVVLVKHYRGLPQFWLRRLWRTLYSVFPNLDRTEQIEVYRSLRRGARPDVDFFVLIVLSSVIATLGLLQNSPAVIIGAMLVAPLMTPILAISMGIARGDVRLLRLSVESALKGIVLALIVAVGVTLLAPWVTLNQEMMIRTYPTLLDLVVALASGAAGAYAIARKDVAAALPGVAIAAALVPPLCVAGAGIALADPSVAGGALLLFFTNLVAISLSGAVVLLLLGFRPESGEKQRQRRLWRGLGVSLVLLLVISVPLGLFLVRTVENNRREQTITEILIQETSAVGSTLTDVQVQQDGKSLHVLATVYSPVVPDRNAVKEIQDDLGRAVRIPVRLEFQVIPVALVPAD